MLAPVYTLHAAWQAAMALMTSKVEGDAQAGRQMCIAMLS